MTLGQNLLFRLLLLRRQAGSLDLLGASRRHQVGAQVACVRLDRVVRRLPFAEICFSVVEDLAGFFGMSKGRAEVTRDNGGVVDEADEAAALTGE